MAELLTAAKPITNDAYAKIEQNSTAMSFANESDRLTYTAIQLWINSQIYKERRMNRVQLYERLYNNELPRKERQLFNVCLPIFGGFEDALQSNLVEPVQLKFVETNPQDYLVVPKIQAQWENERDGLQPNQMWNSKARDLMHDALLSGRAIGKIYAESDPEYRSCFETTNYTNFHCQPLGGGNLENHLFAGEEAIYMTMDEIVENPMFPQEQRDKIKNFSYTDEWWQNVQQRYGTKFGRFKSLGLDIYSNTFTGTKTLMLCQFVVTYKGQRYYVLFDPISQNWLQCEKLEDYLGTSKYPWKSAATHQDSQNFWSKGFSDDIFAIALTISTLLNQELTNREKSNFQARAYDPTIFTDEAKLDAAQYIPDRLVPADTGGGVRKIADGIFAFETPQLQGTINLIEWLETDLGRQTGVSPIMMGTPGLRGVKAAVALGEQQLGAKRIGFQSEGFKEMFAQVGEAYVQGLRDFMPAELMVKTIGEDGYTEQTELKRIELTRSQTIGVKVISSSAEMLDDKSKKDSRVQALTLTAASPNISSKWRDEQILKTIGGFDDAEIKLGMDAQSYGSKKQVAHASSAIQTLLKGKLPDIYYGADKVFLQYIQDFVQDNKTKVMKQKAHPVNGVTVALIALFGEYIQKMAPIVADNETRKGMAVGAGRMGAEAVTGMDSGEESPGVTRTPVAEPANPQTPPPQPAVPAIAAKV